MLGKGGKKEGIFTKGEETKGVVIDRKRMERRGRWKGRGIDFVSGMVENN